MKELELNASFGVAEILEEAETQQQPRKRTISGLVIKYGVVGLTSAGPTMFLPGSIEIPAVVSQVKLLEMHDQERAIGYLEAAEDTPEMLTATFEVSNSYLADEAVERIKDKTRDALSIGFTATSYHFDESDNLVVSAGKWLETSIVTIPAFEDSRITDIAAQRKGAIMPEVPSNPEKQQENDQPQQPITASAPQAPQPMNPPVHSSSDRPSPAQTLAQVAKSIAAGHASGGFFGMQQAIGSMNALTVKAALTDIVPSDDKGFAAAGVSREGWLGELWQARRVDRPTIDSIGNRPLTTMKARGYRRVYPAGKLVDDYAGSKADIPASGKMTTEPVTAEAKRKAGGWDIDRAFFDFNDQEFVQITLEAAYEDYLMQTEAATLAEMLEAATAVSGADVLEILVKLGASAAGLGSALSKVQFAPDMWAQFTGLTTAEVPWWLAKQGSVNLSTTSGNAGEISFNVNPHLPAGTVEAHDSRAATFYEKPIIEVYAENIAKGGVDLGVFGYHASIINDKRAIFKGTLATPPAG